MSLRLKRESTSKPRMCVSLNKLNELVSISEEKKNSLNVSHEPGQWTENVYHTSNWRGLEHGDMRL